MFNIYVSKHTSKWTYENGDCGGGTYNIKDRLLGVAETLNNAMQDAWNRLNFKGDWKDQIERCDSDDNAVQYCRIEDGNWKPLTNSQMHEYKLGHILTFLAVYEFRAEEIRKVSGNEIKDLVFDNIHSKFTNN